MEDHGYRDPEDNCRWHSFVPALPVAIRPLQTPVCPLRCKKVGLKTVKNLIDHLKCDHFTIVRPPSETVAALNEHLKPLGFRYCLRHRKFVATATRNLPTADGPHTGTYLMFSIACPGCRQEGRRPPVITPLHPWMLAYPEHSAVHKLRALCTHISKEAPVSTLTANHRAAKTSARQNTLFVQKYPRVVMRHAKNALKLTRETVQKIPRCVFSSGSDDQQVAALSHTSSDLITRSTSAAYPAITSGVARLPQASKPTALSPLRRSEALRGTPVQPSNLSFSPRSPITKRELQTLYAKRALRHALASRARYANMTHKGRHTTRAQNPKLGPSASARPSMRTIHTSYSGRNTALLEHVYSNCHNFGKNYFFAPASSYLSD